MKSKRRRMVAAGFSLRSFGIRSRRLQPAFFSLRSLFVRRLKPAATMCLCASVPLCLLLQTGVYGQIIKVELDKKSPVNAAVRSAIFPGAGQHFNEERVKGYIFNISGTIMGTATLLLFQRADDKYDDYVTRGKKDDLLYNDYKRKYTQAQVAGVITGAVWLSSIIDAYLTGKKLATGRNFSLLPCENGGVLICWHKKL